MAKPEWGSKHLCASCGIKFYDLQKTPAHCPECGTVAEPTGPSRPRRAAPKPKPKIVKRPVAQEPEEDGLLINDEDEIEEAEAIDVEVEGDDIAEGDDTAEESALIEDASELGNDGDDVAEVLEGGATEGDDVKDTKPET